mmetsp:Transcript_26421/g.62763  ORF Transcript_26421/g.62763 Transcript_26421/m.62763 type:complete len:303 (-) Transcript_26421:598-1506(-)
MNTGQTSARPITTLSSTETLGDSRPAEGCLQKNVSAIFQNEKHKSEPVVVFEDPGGSVYLGLEPEYKRELEELRRWRADQQPDSEQESTQGEPQVTEQQQKRIVLRRCKCCIFLIGADIVYHILLYFLPVMDVAWSSTGIDEGSMGKPLLKLLVFVGVDAFGLLSCAMRCLCFLTAFILAMAVLTIYSVVASFSLAMILRMLIIVFALQLRIGVEALRRWRGADAAQPSMLQSIRCFLGLRGARSSGASGNAADPPDAAEHRPGQSGGPSSRRWCSRQGEPAVGRQPQLDVEMPGQASAGWA